jgi:hypothetical protein
MNIEQRQLPPVLAGGPVAADARKIALEYMLKALECLDSDAEISPVIAAHLQLAVDRLLASTSDGSSMIERS